MAAKDSEAQWQDVSLTFLKAIKSLPGPLLSLLFYFFCFASLLKSTIVDQKPSTVN